MVDKGVQEQNQKLRAIKFTFHLPNGDISSNFMIFSQEKMLYIKPRRGSGVEAYLHTELAYLHLEQVHQFSLACQCIVIVPYSVPK